MILEGNVLGSLVQLHLVLVCQVYQGFVCYWLQHQVRYPGPVLVLLVLRVGGEVQLDGGEGFAVVFPVHEVVVEVVLQLFEIHLPVILDESGIFRGRLRLVLLR